MRKGVFCQASLSVSNFFCLFCGKKETRILRLAKRISNEVQVDIGGGEADTCKNSQQGSIRTKATVNLV